MYKKYLSLHLVPWILTVSLLLSGCGLIKMDEGGALKTETHSIDADNAASVKVQIDMDLGELVINGGAAKLMEGTFQYNVAAWQPRVSYGVDGSQGALLVDQPDKKAKGLVKNGKNRWEMQFSESIPMDIEIKMGAGVSELNLNKIDLTGLNVDTGLGAMKLDLSGSWNHDLHIKIHGGVGGITVKLPKEMGARVEVTHGIGGLTQKGLRKDGDALVNDSFGKSSYTLYLSIDEGTGSVKLEV